jgi:hypothetical protein
MRTIVFALLAWLLAATTPAVAEAWLTVGDADGSFHLQMPVPFDIPPAETAPDGTATFSYVHETPGLALRLEVVDAPTCHPVSAADPVVRASRLVIDGMVRRTRVLVVGARTYRLIAVSSPELEGDAVIHRFLESMRIGD